MNPMPMPTVIEYPKGMKTIVRKAGMATARSVQSILETCCIMRNPTATSAGAAASLGTTAASGERNVAKRKKTPVATEARPVRAPSATPVADSM